MENKKILVWLPSPMGDAILATAALRSIRDKFNSDHITFLANPTVTKILSPSNLNDQWLTLNTSNPFSTALNLRKNKFDLAVLFKNSFASALAVFLAGIPIRIGYERQGRCFFLTEKLSPPKYKDGRFKPMPMVDYYMAIAAWMGCEKFDDKLELNIDENELNRLRTILPEIFDESIPLVIFVPGGAFGPSKCWPAERFAQTADKLIDEFGVKVLISVSPSAAEKKIAKDICNHSKHNLINLAEKNINLGQLKAMFSLADIVVSNDTGPRHIAKALDKKIVTLFGPNNPKWTETDYEKEIKIIGQAPCAPCDKPECIKENHFCMESITVDMVYKAAKKLLTEKQN